MGPNVNYIIIEVFTLIEILSQSYPKVIIGKTYKSLRIQVK